MIQPTFTDQEAREKYLELHPKFEDPTIQLEYDHAKLMGIITAADITGDKRGAYQAGEVHGIMMICNEVLRSNPSARPFMGETLDEWASLGEES